MTDIRSRADQIRREATTKELQAAVRPYSAAKQSMDEYDAGMASAEMRQNDITMSQVVALVRSLSSRIDAAAQKMTPDGMTRRSMARHADELQIVVNELRRVSQEPVTYQQAAE